MDDAAPRSNVPEFTVSEISGSIKRTLETQFSRVRVRGEMTEVKFYGSGHCYFSLKDEESKLRGVIWKGMMSNLAVRPENGVEVIATGKVSAYGGRSDYQIVVDRLEFAGEGALLARIERLRKRLGEEGLFAEERKRPLPFLPEVVGVVTSAQGAVIQDIRTTVERRFPRRIVLWPVAVQGQGAAEQVAAAIRGFNALSPLGAVPRPDVVIVARGGGSLEDLMAFNEEAVVRAAAESDLPLISAVGHETDTTLIDFASDRRAPTPTAAAEIAVPSRAELRGVLDGLGGRLDRAAAGAIERGQWRVRQAAQRLPNLPVLLIQARLRLHDRGERLALAPRALLTARRARLGRADCLPDLPAMIRGARAGLLGWTGRLAQAPRAMIGERQARLEHLAHALPHPREAIAARHAAIDRLASRAEAGARRALDRRALRLAGVPSVAAPLMTRVRVCRVAVRGLGERLEGASYERLLARGFVLVRGEGGRPVTAAAAVGPGARLALQFADGTVEVTASRRGTPGQGKLL